MVDGVVIHNDIPGFVSNEQEPAVAAPVSRAHVIKEVLPDTDVRSLCLSPRAVVAGQVHGRRRLADDVVLEDEVLDHTPRAGPA